MTKKNIFPGFSIPKGNQKTIAIRVNPIFAFFNSTYWPLPYIWIITFSGKFNWIVRFWGLFVAWVMCIAWVVMNCPELHWWCWSDFEQLWWLYGMGCVKFKRWLAGLIIVYPNVTRQPFWMLCSHKIWNQNVSFCCCFGHCRIIGSQKLCVGWANLGVRGLLPNFSEKHNSTFHGSFLQKDICIESNLKNLPF